VFEVEIEDTTKHTTKINGVQEATAEANTKIGTLVCFYIELRWHRGLSRKVQIPIPKKKLAQLKRKSKNNQPLQASLVFKGASLMQAQVGLQFGKDGDRQTFWQRKIQENCVPGLTAITEETGKVRVIPTSPSCELREISWDPSTGKVNVFNRYGNPVLEIDSKSLEALCSALEHIRQKIKALSKAEGALPNPTVQRTTYQK